MAGLLSTLQSTAHSISTLDRQINTSQNNVQNANTPGYVRQRMDIAALPFDATPGLPGGVTSIGVASSRDHFADQSVRGRISDNQSQQAQSSFLQTLQQVFPPDATKGLAGAMNKLWDSFSAWSANPNGTAQRTAVIGAAQALAAQFKTTSGQVKDVRQMTDRQIGDNIQAVNQLAAKIAGLNKNILKNGKDAGTDANLNAALEDLSALANVSVLHKEDGTVTVLLGGQTPLVQGDKSTTLSSESVALPNDAPPGIRILAEDGTDITGQISSGILGGLLTLRQGALASLEGDGTQTGQLNEMAVAMATRINELLTSGFSTLDPAPVAGKALFSFASVGSAAGTFTVTAGFAAGDLAAIQGGNPPVMNGIAMQLAGLPNSSNAADQINGKSYPDFFAAVTTRIGNLTADAADGVTTTEDALLQARNIRQEISGVSLDEEAAAMVQFQRSYQANARMIQAVSEMTSTLIEMIR